MSEDVVSQIKRDYILNLAKEGKRADGRAFDQFRPISIKTNIVQQAEGSARVRIGDTDVFAGVKMALGTPYPDAPNDGTLTTSAELIQMASPDFESGPPGQPAIELARVVDRGIRESKAVNVGKLCVTPGEKIWMTYLDLHIVDYDGNLFDACSLGCMAALMTATVPASKHGVGEDFAMPIDHYPIMTTAMKLAPGAMAFDPSLYEDKVGGPRLSISTDENGNIRAMQKGLEGGLTRAEVRNVVSTGRARANDIRDILFAATGHSKS